MSLAALLLRLIRYEPIAIICPISTRKRTLILLNRFNSPPHFRHSLMSLIHFTFRATLAFIFFSICPALLSTFISLSWYLSLRLSISSLHLYDPNLVRSFLHSNFNLIFLLIESSFLSGFSRVGHCWKGKVDSY